jgi:hypothetical protein
MKVIGMVNRRSWWDDDWKSLDGRPRRVPDGPGDQGTAQSGSRPALSGARDAHNRLVYVVRAMST